MASDTIFALATPPGRSGVAVIRISGPAADRCLRSFAVEMPAPRRASLRVLRAADGSRIDQALLLSFPAPSSFTGEDVVEVQCHGSRAVVSAILDHLGQQPFARPAEAGEFARQAFRNGKLDLAQAEALQDLIHAETSAQRQQALFGMGPGGLGARAAGWRDRLLQALALVEAAIDFSEEPDIAEDAAEQAREILRVLHTELGVALEGAREGERIRSGLTIVIAGPPNAGKSTFLNVLARREAAIVSDIAGTTRDAVEVHLEIGGLPVALVDTAGIRVTQDRVEQEGIRRTRSRANAADLVLWLVGPDDTKTPDFPAKQIWTVRTKADLLNSPHGLSVSAVSPGGFDTLLSKLEQWVRASQGTGLHLVTRERHSALIQRAMAGIAAGIDSDAGRPEMIAADLHDAARSLDEIFGSISTDDILDRVFGEFCIGK